MPQLTGNARICTKSASEMLIRRRLGTIKSLVSDSQRRTGHVVQQPFRPGDMSAPQMVGCREAGCKKDDWKQVMRGKGLEWMSSIMVANTFLSSSLCNLVTISTERSGKRSLTAIVRLLRTKNTGGDFGQQRHRLLQPASKPMSARIEVRRWLQCAYVPLDNSITEISHRSIKTIAARKLCITLSTRTGFEQRQLTQTFAGHMMCGIPSG